jgi:hypothetical protein
MKYSVGITKHERELEGWVFDLPGCHAVAPSRAALGALLPIVIAEHLAWLRGHGESIGAAAQDTHVDVVEEIATKDRAAADGEFVFDDDLRPLDDADIDTAVRGMAYARGELLSLIEPLPDSVLDWRPPASAMARIDPWNPDVRTIREIALDIANSDGYYRNGMSNSPKPPVEKGGALEQLAYERELTVARLHGLSVEERASAFRPRRPWQDRPEEWTARKAIRRIISHERFHTKEIQQRLAWLLLGLPDFGTRATAHTEGIATHA